MLSIIFSGLGSMQLMQLTQESWMVAKEKRDENFSNDTVRSKKNRALQFYDWQVFGFKMWQQG